jgi:trehalose-phosphatase
MTTPALPIAPALTARLHGTPLLLLLDIDGTLAPIAPRPEMAVVPPQTQEILRTMARTEGVHVAFITGRSATDGRRLAGVDEAWVIGNHGMELASPGQAARPRDDVASFHPRVAKAVAEIERLVTDRRWSGVLVEDKTWTLSVHYRLASRRIIPDLTSEIACIAEAAGLRVTSGKEVLELRPPLAVNKGTAALELAESLGALGDGASILAAGDDRTDEDLFRALRARQPNAVTVHVGEAPSTEAEFGVANTDAMRQLLLFLRGLR